MPHALTLRERQEGCRTRRGAIPRRGRARRGHGLTIGVAALALVGSVVLTVRWSTGSPRVAPGGAGSGGFSAVEPAPPRSLPGREQKEIRTADEESLLRALLRMRTVRYRVTEDSGSRGERPAEHLGLVAGEVREALPELVHDEGGTLVVDYPSLAAVAVAAIKRQQQIIDELRTRVERRERDLSDVRERLDALEREIDPKRDTR